MNQSAVYIKTGKGQREVATRQHQLPRRARALLIIVDGKMSAFDILSSSSSIGESESFFQQLIDEGFISELGKDGKPAPAATSRRADGQPPDTLLELKRYVLLILRDVLGNRDAAGFRILIDAANSAAEIGRIVPLHRDVPWGSHNQHRSDDYIVLGRRLGQEHDAAIATRG
jgi:hypothetical protein